MVLILDGQLLYTRTSTDPLVTQNVNAHNQKALQRFLVQETRDGRKEKTLTLDRTAIKLFTDDHPANIETVQDDQWHEFLDKHALKSAWTHNSFLNVLNKFRVFLGMKRLDRKFRKPKPNPRINLQKTDDDYEKMYTSCTNDRDRVILAVFRYGGLRAGEMVGLTVGSFDVHDDYITISFYREKTNIQAEVVLVEPAPLIAKYLRGKSTDEPAFRGRDGLALKYVGFYRVIERLCKKTGVKFHPHLFRHYRATELAKENLTKWDLDNMFGWKTNGNTASTYVNLSNDETIKKVKMLGGVHVEETERVVIRCKRCETILPKENDFCPRCGLSKNTGDALMAAQKQPGLADLLKSMDINDLADLVAQKLKK